MKVDLYTKVVLSVIAICLTVSTLQKIDIIPEAHANEIKTPATTLPVNTNYGLVPLNEDGSIDVNLKSSSSTMSVDISSVHSRAFDYCTVPVKME